MIQNGEYCVYCHTNKINGKKYIGQTKLDLDKRCGSGGQKYKGSRHFWFAIQKYGWDNFDHEIIASNLTLDEANNFEILLIDKLNTRNPDYGYNIASGGFNKEPSEETLKIWKEQRSGENNYWARPVICDGKRFGHIGECAKHYGLNRELINSYLTGRLNMPQKFIDMGLRYEDEPDREYRPQTGFARGNNPRARAVICDGVEYSCVNDCADFYHVKFHTMINWLTKEKRMPKKFIELGLHFVGDDTVHEAQIGGVRHVVCEGVYYDTITDCAKYYNVKVNRMSRWLSGDRKMPQEFVDKKLMYAIGGDIE